MATLHVEKLGGLAGFGGARSRLRSRGQLEFSTLSAQEQEIVELLFQLQDKPITISNQDGFRYRISRKTPSGTDTIEVAESQVPAVISNCVKDELI
jgi:hypothetical protein